MAHVLGQLGVFLTLLGGFRPLGRFKNENFTGRGLSQVRAGAPQAGGSLKGVSDPVSVLAVTSRLYHHFDPLTP